jgi:hypothetical protein
MMHGMAGRLAVGDGIALLLFSFLGLATHGQQFSVAAVARNTVPLLLGWFAVALLFGTYTRPRRGVLVLTWALGVGGGVVLRSLWLGHPKGAAFAIFLLITLGVTGVLIVAWRALARRIGALQRVPPG